jgi:ACS family tartrate transporter-like MFS transporter
MVSLAPSTDVGNRARTRIMRRILPYLFLLYIVNYLDRVNVSYANLEMTKALNFTAEVFGFGAGIFFAGYFLFEIPGTLLIELWSARAWIARIMITWGIVAVLMGFMNSATQFYWLRLGLGAAEAGFFPGMIVYLTHWFRYQDRAKTVALFMAAVPLSNFFGSPVSGLILGVNWFGLAGWRWLFILEGAPAIILGVVTIFYLTDWPHQAKWLAEDEREWIISELAKEKEIKTAAHSFRVLEALRHREVVLLALAYFFIVTGLYGFSFWLPTIVKALSGLPNFLVTMISALPYFTGFVALMVVGWSSDRSGERRWHTAVPMIVAGIGLLLSALTQANAALAVAMFCVAAAGLYSFLPSFWALPTAFLTGSAAAAAIGLINSVGNLGGFVGPYVVGYLNTRTNSFLGGMLYLSFSALVGAGLILTLRSAKSEVRSPKSKVRSAKPEV